MVQWRARIGIPVGGFSAKDQPAWYERVYLSLFLPLRRELSKDWFRIVLRFGHVGGEESSYEPDPYDDVIQFNMTSIERRPARRNCSSSSMTP